MSSRATSPPARPGRSTPDLPATITLHSPEGTHGAHPTFSVGQVVPISLAAGGGLPKVTVRMVVVGVEGADVTLRAVA